MSTDRVARRRRQSSRTLGLANAYRARIADAIRCGFPKLAAAVGQEAFDALVVAYLTRYPSTRLSVRGAGQQLPEFLARSTEYPVWQGELALIDRACTNVLDAEDVPLATAAVLAADFTVRLIPAHVLVEITTNVDELWRSIHASELPAFPRELDWPRTLLVWRARHVQQRTVDADEVAALGAASRGIRLAQLCSRFAAPNPMARAVDIVLRWIEDGVVASP